MNDQKSLLDRIASSEMYRNYARAFSEATGLPLHLRAAESWRATPRGVTKENGFCALMAQKNSTCAGCLRMQAEIAGAATDGPAILKCEFGLTEAAVPLKLGEQTIGYLVTGQVFLKDVTEKQVEKVLATVAGNSALPNRAEVRAAYLATRVMSRAQLAAALRLLAVFGEHLADKCNHLATQQAHAEPVAVVRAKAYIREHLGEEIGLEDVARAACTSTFYICKLFKKHTGLNTTEFISRLRIERTRELLGNPNLRISEIAFEVGFQSLTHFNRVFRKFVGESPTTHREHLALPLAA